MADALKINALTQKSADIKAYSAHRISGGFGSYSVHENKSGRTFDYSAIKLTDDDKRYRLGIKKQSDDLLAAAETITQRFPPLFSQMITSYNKTKENINEILNDNEAEKTADKYTEDIARSVNETDNKINEDNDDAGEEKENAVKRKAEERPENAAPLTEERQELDVEGIAGAINNFVDGFNGLLSKSNESGAYAAQSTSAQLVGAYEDFKEELSEIGLVRGDDEAIEIDREKLDRAIENGSAKKTLTEENGFTDRVARIARESIRFSDRFIEKSNPSADSRPVKNTSVNYNYVTNVSIDN